MAWSVLIIACLTFPPLSFYFVGAFALQETPAPVHAQFFIVSGIVAGVVGIVIGMMAVAFFLRQRPMSMVWALGWSYLWTALATVCFIALHIRKLIG